MSFLDREKSMKNVFFSSRNCNVFDTKTTSIHCLFLFNDAQFDASNFRYDLDFVVFVQIP